MNFNEHLELIYSTAPIDESLYKNVNALLLATLSKNFLEFAKSLDAAPLGIKHSQILKVKSRIVKVIPAAENSIGIINYRRINTYIEFYNEENKKCIRLVISTRNNGVLCGFYGDYVKNGKNNHFNEKTTMFNEMLAPMNVLGGVEFMSTCVNFLCGSMDTPYVTREKMNLN